MKRMLINATQAEELRVAIVDGQKLFNLDIEVPSKEQKKSNIYKAVITRIEPSLEAAFVDYGAERHGFLPFKEINKRYLSTDATDDNGRPLVKEGIKEGQELIVQVEKEERGNKGAALTTHISLAGRYLVAMPHNPRSGGVSRRIEGEERAQVREALAEMNLPEDMGVIVRTAGVGRSGEELQRDLDYLTRIWDACEAASESRAAPFLIYQESNLMVRALRDHYRDDIGEIVIDEAGIHKQAHDFMSMAMQDELRKLKHYDERIPLFNRYQIESQIESAFQREVRLPSGGSIVIDPTEALTAIDINSARSTKGSDIEDTAFNTNLEAAEEIARQLRLRDLGGLVVIDFIDMSSNRHQKEVENRLREALRYDRARVQINRISKFGLLEMSRQRLRPSLGESSKDVCPRCEGHGTIRSIESTALAVLRICEEESLKESTGRVITQLPIEVATFLVNEKRQQLAEVEARNNIEIIVVPNKALETPHYVIERVRMADQDASASRASYEQATIKEETYVPELRSDKTPVEQAAVQTIAPSAPIAPAIPAAKTAAPAAKNKPRQQQPGLFKKILLGLLSIFGLTKQQGKQKTPARGRQQNRNPRNNRNQRSGNNQNRNQRNNRNQGNQGNRNNQGRNQNRNQNSNQNRNQNRNQQQDKQQQAKNQHSEQTADQRKSRKPQSEPQQTRKRVSDNEGNEQRQDGDSRSRSNRNRNRNRNRNNDNRNSAGRQDKPQGQSADKPDNRERQQQEGKPVTVTVEQQPPASNKPAAQPQNQGQSQNQNQSQSKPANDKPAGDSQPQAVTNTSVLAYAERKAAAAKQAPSDKATDQPAGNPAKQQPASENKAEPAPAKSTESGEQD